MTLKLTRLERLYFFERMSKSDFRDKMNISLDPSMNKGWDQNVILFFPHVFVINSIVDVDSFYRLLVLLSLKLGYLS